MVWFRAQKSDAKAPPLAPEVTAMLAQDYLLENLNWYPNSNNWYAQTPPLIIQDEQSIAVTAKLIAML